VADEPSGWSIGFRLDRLNDRVTVAPMQRSWTSARDDTRRSNQRGWSGASHGICSVTGATRWPPSADRIAAAGDIAAVVEAEVEPGLVGRHDDAVRIE
jgi:hypothetical protein